ncbi:MAG: translation initiation factor IF-2 subunit beta [Promethearchaeota archaeon]
MPPKTTKKPAKKAKSAPKVTPKTKSKAKPKSSAKAKAMTKPKPTKAKTTTTTPHTDDYEALLKRARDQIPPEVFDQPRFQLPEVDSFIQGSRTIIRNFKDITDTLRRDPKHLIRFLAHELATAGELQGAQAMFNGRFTSRALEDLVAKYTDEFVVCPVCQRPDTEIRREDRLLMLVCSACGGRTPLKG